MPERAPQRRPDDSARRWTVRGVLDAATSVLGERGIDDPRLEASLLLAHALGVRRLDLYMQMDRPLTDGERAAYRALIKERARRVPTAYLTGTRGFYTLDLEVTPDTLIPRPDTERLVEAALDDLKGREGAVLCDIGTGTGAIAVTVAKLGRAHLARVLATDHSDQALAVARRNAERHEVHDLVECLAGDLYAPLRDLAGTLDLVLSNPPYIAERDRPALAPEVLHEPATALFAGPDGLTCLRRLIADAPSMLAPSGRLLLEIGHDQAAAVTALAHSAGLTDVHILQDLDSRDRVLSALRPA